MSLRCRTGLFPWKSIPPLLAALLVLVGLHVCAAAQTSAGGGAGAQSSGGGPDTSRTGGKDQTIAVQSSEPRIIDGHLLENPYQLIKRSGTPHENFRAIAEERLWATSEIVSLREALDKLLSQPREAPVPVPEMSERDYNNQVADLDNQIMQMEAKQNDSKATETERSQARVRLLELTRQKARAAMQFTEYRQFTLASKQYDDLARQTEATRQALTAATGYAAKLDDAINELLTSDDSQSSFRLWMGGGFVALVTILILGFFGVGIWGGFMKDIFKDDRGLQFITLFSLVIAITLFGLLNILEGKELAALLGGLSGYILGRSNLGAQSPAGHE